MCGAYLSSVGNGTHSGPSDAGQAFGFVELKAAGPRLSGSNSSSYMIKVVAAQKWSVSPLSLIIDYEISYLFYVPTAHMYTCTSSLPTHRSIHAPVAALSRSLGAQRQRQQCA